MKITDREKMYQHFANSAALRNFSNSAALNVWYDSERISLITRALEIAQKAVNKELKALYEDGTLAKLSKTYYGGDYAPSADNYK